MADKRIDELEAASAVTSNDLFVLEQANTAKKLTAQILENWLVTIADGHGGIQSIVKTGSSGTNPVKDTYTITFADMTTFSFIVTNGIKGDTGATGPQGPKGDNITISLHEVKYQAGSSGTTAPSGTWQSTIPTVAQGEYLWTRTVINYSDGTGITFYSVARQGLDGTGAVSTVNNIYPDAGGNVTLTPSDIGALPSTYTAPVTSVNGDTGTVVITASGIGAATVTDGKVTPSEASSAISTKTANYTLALGDAGKMIVANSSSAITVTIPTNASVAFPVGTEIEIVRKGSGAVTIAGATGVTLDSIDSAASIAAQYGVVGIKKLDTNEWLLCGALG